MRGKDKVKDKEQDMETAASETITSPWDACQSNRDLSQDRNAQDAALAKTIAEAVAREMAKAQVHYEALLNDRGTATIQTSLKVSSGANGFKVMDPRDGNYGQKRVDLPLMPWKVTQKGLKSLTSITGSMEREWDTLSHGKKAKPSSTSLHMNNSMKKKKKASTPQKV